MSKANHAIALHFIWATSGRAAVLTAEVRAWLWPAIAQKAREVGALRVVVGGSADHVHVAAVLPPTMAPATFAKGIKGASSRLLHERAGLPTVWQAGYGVFSFAVDVWPAVESYVLEQVAHHATSRDHDLPHDGVQPSEVPKGLLEP